MISERKDHLESKSFCVFQLIGKPVQALVETVTARGAGGLDVPVTLAQSVKAELVGDFGSVHRLRKIL